jgi:peptidoglycan/LPS O-acetylase OafA/YrhL
MSPHSGFHTAAPRERIPELDILRGLAFLAVVFQHALGYYGQAGDILPAEAAVLGMMLHFTKFAVPAFVFVTGAVLFYNYFEGVSYPHFIKKRCVDILVPYIIWTCLYEMNLNGPPPINFAWLTGFGQRLLSGSEVYHLWFVIMIFQFYLAYPLLLGTFKIAREMLPTRPRMIAAAVLLTGGYAWLLWVSYSFIPEKNVHFGYPLLQTLLIDNRDRNFLLFIFYFFLGGLAGAGIIKWRAFVRRSVSWNGFLFAFLYVWVGYELLTGGMGGRIDFNLSTPLKPSMFFYIVSELLLVYGLATAISGRVSFIRKFLAFAGKYSYGAYLSHVLVLKYTLIQVGELLPAGHNILASLLAFVLCSLGSLALVFLIGTLPLGRLIIGPVTGSLPFAFRRPDVRSRRGTIL